MSIIQSEYAKLNKTAPYPAFSGQAVAHRFAMTVTTATQAGDILELGILPPNCRVIDAVLDSDAFGGTTFAVDVGIMDGQVGDTDPARTCGNELFAGTDVVISGGAARPDSKGAFRIAAAAVARSIGVKLSEAPPSNGVIGLTLIVATD